MFACLLSLYILYIYIYISYNCILTITFTLLNYEPKEEVEEDDMDLSFSPRGPDPRPPLPSMGDFSSPRSLHEPSQFLSDVELDRNSNLTPATSGPKPLSSHVARYPRIKSEGVLRHQSYDPGPLMSSPFWVPGSFSIPILFPTTYLPRIPGISPTFFLFLSEEVIW